jgi:hypothetical protein
MKRGKREYNTLLANLSLGLILLLSGCTQFPNNDPDKDSPLPPHSQPLFDLNTASFYNPLTNTSDNFYVRNLNASGSVFLHENQMEIIVGLRDGKGYPGIAYNLTLRVIYTWFDQWTEEINLTERLGVTMTTNTSGLAHLIVTYNQYSWPRSYLSTEGFLEITSPQLNNTVGTSKEWFFRYYYKKIVRNTTAEGGLAAIDYIENSNLIEEAISMGGEENRYINWTKRYYDITRVIINRSTIQYYTEYHGKPRIKITYLAWAIPCDGLNLTYPSIKNEWRTYNGSKYALSNINEEYLGNEWLITEPITQVNITAGWLIMQQIKIDAFNMALDAWGVTVYQISLVTTDLQLRWLLSSSEEWVS